MKEVVITCNKWDGHDHARFLSSIRTDLLEGHGEFNFIRETCSKEPLEGGYAYRYEEWEDGHLLDDRTAVVYHATRNDLL